MTDLLLYLAILLNSLLLSSMVNGDEIALRECANLHRIQVEALQNPSARFENSGCRLHCLEDGRTLAIDPLNEGFACPTEHSGICHSGECIGTEEEALRECTKLHNLNFHVVKWQGTAYSNHQCLLSCVIDGATISRNEMDQGKACPTNPDGVCRGGQCIHNGNGHEVTTPTTRPTTPTTPLTTTTTTELPKVTKKIVDQNSTFNLAEHDIRIILVTMVSIQNHTTKVDHYRLWRCPHEVDNFECLQLCSPGATTTFTGQACAGPEVLADQRVTPTTSILIAAYANAQGTHMLGFGRYTLYGLIDHYLHTSNPSNSNDPRIVKGQELDMREALPLFDKTTDPIAVVTVRFHLTVVT